MLAAENLLYRKWLALSIEELMQGSCKSTSEKCPAGRKGSSVQSFKLVQGLRMRSVLLEHWRALTALLIQFVSVSLIDPGRVSSDYGSSACPGPSSGNGQQMTSYYLNMILVDPFNSDDGAMQSY
eukprot:1147918-Pelagomonas_calceolata.AAC.5